MKKEKRIARLQIAIGCRGERHRNRVKSPINLPEWG